MTEFEDFAPPSDDVDTDEELQEAFAAGLIKPGLNRIFEQKKREQINNIPGLKQKLSEFEVKLPWIEKLDMINKPAPLAPELAMQEDLHQKQREKLLKNSKAKMTLADDPVHNDFKREMIFYRQAQAAVLEAIPRLKSMGIPTRRPDDYFAQMAKTDDHMKKIRQKLLTKQTEQERIEKIRKLRDLKKFGKQVQVQVQQARQKEKKDMLDQVKKFRKGQSDTIDFLEDPKAKGKKGKGDKGSIERRKSKDKKYGFGGKKKGAKSNTKNSTNDVTGYRKPLKMKGGKMQRPGKSKRQKMKNKNKK